MDKQYFVLTGNPFVDAGIFALEALYNRLTGNKGNSYKSYKDITPQDLESSGIIPFIVKLYQTESWNKNLFSIFTNDSKYTTNTRNLKDKREELSKEFLSNLLSQFTPAGKSGSCIACGRREPKSLVKRVHIPLTGSGGMTNFFPSLVEGESYCPVCTFAVQFIPLVIYHAGGVNYLLIHSMDENIMRIWAKEGINNLDRQKALDSFSSENLSGCMKDDEYQDSVNALFHILTDKIVENVEIFSNVFADVYIFSNRGQKNRPLDRIHVPNNILLFLRKILQVENGKSAWQEVVYRGSRHRHTDKKNFKKQSRNMVYQGLIDGRSIIYYFIDSKNKKIVGNEKIFILYLREVKNMKDKQIETLMKVGDKIASFVEETGEVRVIRDIEGTRSFEGFKNVLLRIEKQFISYGIKEPLFTTEQFLKDLFPEGAMSWKETRDILLFRLYEKLHDYLISSKKEGKLNEEDLEENLDEEEIEEENLEDEEVEDNE